MKVYMHITKEIFLYLFNIPIPVNYRSLCIVTVSFLYIRYIFILYRYSKLDNCKHLEHSVCEDICFDFSWLLSIMCIYFERGISHRDILSACFYRQPRKKHIESCMWS